MSCFPAGNSLGLVRPAPNSGVMRKGKGAVEEQRCTPPQKVRLKRALARTEEQPIISGLGFVLSPLGPSWAGGSGRPRLFKA